ncbi:MAG: diphthine--ammonia ligase [Bacteroidia bacterium]|nr:diphthine--ammonia ligase [Bacteroidia bacterium]
MIKKEKVIFCWSGGKDSALALYKILNDESFEVVSLLTTLNETYRRISMHGVREELLDEQAQKIGLPLVKIYVKEGTNTEYEQKMEEVLLNFKSKGVDQVVFGDIFLEDLRAYREKNLSKIGMKARFPLWKKDTSVLVNEFLDLGFKTIVCCVNDSSLDDKKVGVKLDSKYLKNLPEEVDPCGENGEFHTFCYDGPVFKEPVKFDIGEKVYKALDPSLVQGKTKGFWYCDLIREHSNSV